MAKKKKEIMIIRFTEEGDSVNVNTEFPTSIKVGKIYDLVGKAISGLILTARKIGAAKGLTKDEVDDAIFKGAE